MFSSNLFSNLKPSNEKEYRLLNCVSTPPNLCMYSLGKLLLQMSVPWQPALLVSCVNLMSVQLMTERWVLAYNSHVSLPSFLCCIVSCHSLLSQWPSGSAPYARRYDYDPCDCVFFQCSKQIDYEMSQKDMMSSRLAWGTTDPRRSIAKTCLLVND